jgi:hypothetical protein
VDFASHRIFKSGGLWSVSSMIDEDAWRVRGLVIGQIQRHNLEIWAG